MKLIQAMPLVLAVGAAGASGVVPSCAIAQEPQRSDLTEADLARVRSVTEPTADFAKAEKYERMSGGKTTTEASITSDSFSHPSANLTFEGKQDFAIGNGLFRKLWVSAPSSTQASDGLGPLFNARSCQLCHRKDGRGHPPSSAADQATSFVLQLAVPKSAQHSDDVELHPEPTYGKQLQDVAVPGLIAEGKVVAVYEEMPVALSGEQDAHLRVPVYSIASLGYGPISPDVVISPRVAPPMIGLGLLESVHDADIAALADPDDDDRDGISGRASYVQTPDGTRIARFGWKASTTTVKEQSANAFNVDIGISSPESTNPHGDCTAAQKLCEQFPTGVQSHLGDTEAPDPILNLVAFYSSNLAVPARRGVTDPEVLQGKELFYSAGCASCHNPKFVTRRDVEQKELQFQLIWPYTDLLLHDMGEGLADHHHDPSGREWRTTPLWGIGLTQTVSGHTFLLHDGRARNVLEAILWHGGEAQRSRDTVANMTPEERSKLLKFVNSL